MTTLQVRIDKELRDQAMDVCNSMGLDLSTAIRMFCKRLVMDKALPFTPKADPFYNESNQHELKTLIADITHGINCASHDVVKE